jgi:hypothetical protein
MTDPLTEKFADCKKTDPFKEKSADCYLLRALAFFRNGITLNVYGALTIHHLSSLTDTDSEMWLSGISEERKKRRNSGGLNGTIPLLIATYREFAL